MGCSSTQLRSFSTGILGIGGLIGLLSVSLVFGFLISSGSRIGTEELLEFLELLGTDDVFSNELFRIIGTVRLFLELGKFIEILNFTWIVRLELAFGATGTGVPVLVQVPGGVI